MNCNNISFATLKLVAKKDNLLQLPKSLLKPLATAVPATTEVVAKTIFSNEIWVLATTFFVAKNDFSCSELNCDSKFNHKQMDYEAYLSGIEVIV